MVTGDDGVERTDDEELMLHGRCHLFAVALSELTGLPIGAYLDTDIETERTVLVHAFVVDGDIGIDIRGRVPLDDIIEGEFDTFEPELVMISREDVLLLGHGRGTISQRNPELLVAKRLAASLVERLDEPPPPTQMTGPSP
ncbi:hypothetical protein OIU34_20130 [Pararhizobium sp. BT-229]|uniref:hypothetical protein n=1 Tax=Pararhizobium sp. BT-229 TaxID=2986923 RepID=UPI0021F6D133|nr:hypothetical protein [Pararhizobium sp. BT-229]MCV9964196.1 hypothetical protein [Pararhizobium sp. BT-229]